MFNDGGFGDPSMGQEDNFANEKIKVIDEAIGRYRVKALESVQNQAVNIMAEDISQEIADICEVEPDIKDPVLQSVALLKLSYLNAISYIVAGNIELGIDELRQTRDFAEYQQLAAGDVFEALYDEINSLIREIIELKKSS